jgi:hypothetical protein
VIQRILSTGYSRPREELAASCPQRALATIQSGTGEK